MFTKSSIYTPQQQTQQSCTDCQYHLKGCCFDPTKNNKGFLAAPCFGCTELDDD